jgi:hypothetical protein
MIGSIQGLLGWGWTLPLYFLLSFPVYAYDEITVDNGGTISGVIRFRGEVPKLPPPEVTKFKEVCKNIPNESLVVGPGEGIRYAVVALRGIAKGKAVEREIVYELDNVQCRFVPHVQAASVGQFLVLKNTDPILHTAHAFFGNSHSQPQFNVGLYPGRISRKPLITPGLVKIRCEVHPWMSAYVMVTEHPYHAVTDIYGAYLINDVPPGTYQLEVWHETLGTHSQRVVVKAGATSKVDFALSGGRR